SDAGLDHARLSDCRGLDRRCRHAGRISARHPDLSRYREHPAFPVLADQHRIVLAGALLPVAASGGDELQGDHGGPDHGARTVAFGNALSIVAGGAARSGRSAALRVIGTGWTTPPR